MIISYQVLIHYCPLTEFPFGGLGNKHWLVDRPINPHFTGRREVIDKIINRITSEDAKSEQRRFVLTGMGGQGKSEICLHVANEVRNRSVPCAVADAKTFVLIRLYQVLGHILGRCQHAKHSRGELLRSRRGIKMPQNC